MRRPIRPDGEEEDEEAEEFAPRVYRPHVAINVHHDDHTYDDVAIAIKKAPPSTYCLLAGPVAGPSADDTLLSAPHTVGKWLAHLPLGIRLSVTAVLLVIFFLVRPLLTQPHTHTHTPHARTTRITAHGRWPRSWNVNAYVWVVALFEERVGGADMEQGDLRGRSPRRNAFPLRAHRHLPATGTRPTFWPPRSLRHV